MMVAALSETQQVTSAAIDPQGVQGPAAKYTGVEMGFL